jgi:hypothetical protein
MTCSSNLNYVEKFKKDENTWNTVKLCKKYQNWKSSFNYCTFSKEKKTQPKNKKITSLPRAQWGPRHRHLCRGWAVGKEVYSADSSSQLSTKAVNRGKLWSKALPRAGPRLSAQVASSLTAQRQSRRHSGRQPKCDGARSFSDGAILAECCPSAKTWLCRRSLLPTDRPSAKVTMPWVLLCRERLSAKLFCAEGPVNSRRQRAKRSAKPEFPSVNGYV